MKKILVILMLLTSLVFATPRVDAAFGSYKDKTFIVIRATGVKSFILTSPVNPEYVMHLKDKPNMWFIQIPDGVTEIPELEFLMDGKPITTDPIKVPEQFQHGVKKEMQYGGR